MSNLEPQYRYPGLEPFGIHQKDLFFGRRADLERLTEMVKTHQQVLLYAKSGLGKSSLINAGLVPKLLESGNSEIIQVRIGAFLNPIQSDTPLQAIHNELPSAPETFLDRIIAQEGSLWRHFKALSISGPKVYYLIFDQFEELFSHPEEDIFAFKKQMADLLYRVVPQQFKAVLEIKQRDAANLLRQDEIEALFEPMDVRVLYAIREDRYSELNRLSDYLPDLLHNRFQLAPLTRAHAEEGIVQPALLRGNFISDPFTYEPDALTKILDYLTSNGHQAVETTQLQILCSHIERQCKAKVTIADVPEFDNIFLQFYFDSIACILPDFQQQTREFIEEYMIIEGQRMAYHERYCLEYVPSEALEILLKERHLFRTERSSTGGVSYELAHDTLVGPILLAKRQREEEALAAEVAKRAEAERLAQQAEQDRLEQLLQEKSLLAKRNRNRWIKWGLVGAIALLLSIWGMVTFYSFYQEAKASKNSLAKTLVIVTQLQQKNQRLVDAFYVFEDSLAVAFNGTYFGFVNSDGEVKVPYDFSSAEPFRKVGFARVENESGKFLLTTAGTRYEVSNEIDLHSNSIEALDFVGGSWASEIFPMIAGNPLKVISLQNVGYVGTAPNSLGNTSLQWEIGQDSLWRLKDLEVLAIENSGVTNISPNIGGLQNLRRLSLTGNRISSLPNEIGALQQLVRLDLSGNLLVDLPDALGNLSELREFRCYGNAIKALPTTFWNLIKLSVLDLGTNRFEQLPVELGNLKELRSLILDENQLKGLPQSICKLKELRQLELYGNQLSVLPDSIGYLQELQVMDLAANQLKMLPNSFYKLGKLRLMDLSENQLTNLPSDIGHLRSLEVVNLNDNKIKSLPERAELINLRRLLLIDNQLTSVPNSIGELVNLEVLHLAGNDLSKFPLEITKLTKLEHLGLDGNAILEVPKEIVRLALLKTLGLGNIGIKTLPVELGNLVNLIMLNIEGNHLEAFPTEISKMRKLKTLSIGNNPFSDTQEKRDAIRKQMAEWLPNCTVYFD